MAKFWHSLTQASPKLESAEDRLRASLLAGLLLILIPAGLASIIVQLILVPGFEKTFFSVLPILALLTVAYVVARSKWYQIATVVTVVAVSAAPFAALVFDPSDSLAISFLLIPMLISSMLLTSRQTLVVATILVVGLSVLLQLQEDMPWRRNEPGAIFLVLILCSLVFTFRLHRKRIEAARREELAFEASHDELTGLLNRRYLEARLARFLIRARKDAGKHYLVFINLDQFRLVNDTGGRFAGDELLRQIAQLFLRHTPSAASIARMGADEFALILEHSSDDAAFRVANVVRHVLRDFRFHWNEQIYEIAASFGIAEISSDSDSVSQILHQAEQACMAAKEEGRGRIRVYKETKDELSTRLAEQGWVGRIKRGIEKNEFVLYGQRIANTDPRDGELQYLEVLLRLQGDGDVIPPGRFLPTAERYALMPQIDRWVVSSAIHLLENGSGENTPQLAINLSGSTLSDERFVDYVARQLAKKKIKPELICFELTETNAIANTSRAAHFIETMRNLGCRFALDDFGTGLSSFEYLKIFPVDIIKIDQRFTKDVTDSPVDMEMVRAVVHIARLMNIKTVAEGVETPDQSQRLTDLGVDFLQGFHIHVPEPLENLEQQPS